MRIQILDEQLVNQIAAGEVVERPASVVKELVENAIDANSRHILVSIEEGGLKKIEVEDDGEGMTEEEIPCAFQRHATSKIRCENDLHRLSTLGFRGEALPSIASVSRVKIDSARQGKSGAFAVLEGGDIREHGACPASSGTRIVVEELFFNTPARRKFMKTVTTEFHKVHDLMVRQALSRTDISFTFQHNGKVYFKTPGTGRLPETVAALWGRKVLECFIPVEWEGETGRVSGLISRPEYKRGNRQRQLFFVNGRMVQDMLLSRALDEGYRGLLISKEYPAAVLFLTLNQDEIDCNVHPQKMQVRFREEGKVFQIIRDTVREALSGLNHQLGFGAFAERAAAAEAEAGGKPPRWASLPPKKTGDTPPLNHSMYLFTEKEPVQGVAEAAVPYEPYPAVGPGLEEWEAEQTFQKEQAERRDIRQNFRIVGQAFQGYILLEYENTLWIVDQHAAHERINYNRILQKLHDNQPLTQMLVMPQVLEVTPREMDTFSQKREELERLGFVMEVLGERTLILRGVPETCANAWEHSPDTIESLHDITSAASIERMAARLACKKSVKDGEKLTMDEMRNVIGELLATEDFRHCPHGRPTFIEISHDDLEKKFKRT